VSSRFQFVADHQRRNGVKRLCTILGIARSSFYYWRRTAPERSARQAADARLAARIRHVHRDSDGTYGVPRVTAELRDGGGQTVNHKRVARVMRAIGLAGVRLRRRHRTTVADPAAVKAPDLIGRDFTAPAVNAKYVGDITATCSHFLIGGRVPQPYEWLGLPGRKVERTELVIDALQAAERTRGSLAGAVMHTDHGSQLGLNRSSQHQLPGEIVGAR
jgi:transposase InsO family protein